MNVRQKRLNRLREGDLIVSPYDLHTKDGRVTALTPILVVGRLHRFDPVIRRDRAYWSVVVSGRLTAIDETVLSVTWRQA